MNAHRTWKQRFIELAILVGVLVVAVLVVVASGIFPVRASDGHWAITEAFLQFASKRSIQTNSLNVETKPLDEPGMMRLGAATYASNCAWCHGSPSEPYPTVASAMLPRPPHLVNAAIDWDNHELFYIAKHGIMLTGMPAWPTQARDDDIWPLVAFLHEMGNMDSQQYQLLLGRTAHEPNQSIDVHSEANWMKACVDCHGRDGRSVAGPRVPDLQNLSHEYIALTIQAMRSGERPTGIMQPIATRLSDTQVEEVARYFSGLAKGQNDKERNASSISGESDLVAEGMKLVNEGDAARKIPACIECHGLERSSASYPSLLGQSTVYIESQLKLYADGSRLGGEAKLMHDIADKLSEKQKKEVAAAFQFLRYGQLAN